MGNKWEINLFFIYFPFTFIHFPFIFYLFSIYFPFIFHLFLFLFPFSTVRFFVRYFWGVLRKCTAFSNHILCFELFLDFNWHNDAYYVLCLLMISKIVFSSWLDFFAFIKTKMKLVGFFRASGIFLSIGHRASAIFLSIGHRASGFFFHNQASGIEHRAFRHFFFSARTTLILNWKTML